MDAFVANLEPNLALEVSDLLLEDELHTLHDWERKNIYIKNKKANLARWVHEVILRFRCQLIDEKVAALQSDTAEDRILFHKPSQITILVLILNLQL